MPGVDPLNNLDSWPLKGLDEFIAECNSREISEVNLTGSDTDPTLYRHLDKLSEKLRSEIPNLRLGLRTNGIKFEEEVWSLFDKASISVTSLNPQIYKKTMGGNRLPDVERINNFCKRNNIDLKVNIVLCPELAEYGDLGITIKKLAQMGIERINLREPYGQPRIGDPLAFVGGMRPMPTVYGMQSYMYYNTRITYWDVHYVEVESVNLYANGNVSINYPVSSGHDPNVGIVLDQSNFNESGRQFPQRVNKKKV